MHAFTTIARRPQAPAYVTLTRRVQGAHASGDAYRKGRRGSLADTQAIQPASSNEVAVVLPFRPR